MKRIGAAVVLALVLAMVFSLTASATKPDYYLGQAGAAVFIPDFANGTLTYDVHDDILDGIVVQPLDFDPTPPNSALQGVFYESGTGNTCHISIVPVSSRPGRAILNQCTGDLAGLHGRFVINADFSYIAWYHWEP